ncbi:Gfo/Idh/MocA family protein [Streptomyces sp. NPDC058335]|uniref:Gfo/Idh/MocA family protein n=1 Tax=Streptomyces sp. NPDC058335 TaxID=3346451 RepID=UPI00365CC0E3
MTVPHPDGTRPVPSPVKVAVVGLGWAGRSIWLPRLHRHPAFQVVAGVDADPAAREAAGAEVPGLRLVTDVAALHPADLDLAVVAVPNHLHTTVACRLLERSVPVFLEKPVCLNSAEAEQLAAAERAGGSVLLAGSAARHRTDMRELAAVVATLGRVRHVDISWVRASGVPDAGGWFTRRELSGGGALVDLGWHLLDALGPLLGPVDYGQVTGTVSDDFVNSRSRRAAWRQDGQEYDPETGTGDVEDTARGFLVTEDGVSVALRASWASHQATDVTAITVEGSAGTATLRCTFGFSPNRLDGSVLTVHRDGEHTLVDLPHSAVGSEYDRQLDALTRLLGEPDRQGKAIDEVRHTIAVIERIYASARTTQVREPRT